MDLLNFTTQLNKDYRSDCAEFNSDSPWFAHFTLMANEQPISFKIGNTRHHALRIIDWRHPMSKGFYDAQPGDYFDLDDYQTSRVKAERYAPIAGNILQHTMVVNNGRAIRQATIKTAQATHIVEADGQQFVLLSETSTRFGAVDGLPDIRALLTKKQYQLITTSNLQPVIIQGQAGSGKTTVALYRVSWLMYKDSEHIPVDPKKVLIVMFNKALQSYVANTLEPLGLESANLFTFHAWALEEVKNAYNGKIEIYIDKIDGANIASGIKKQIGILKAMDEFVQNQTDRLCQWVEQKLQPYNASDWVEQLRNSNQPIVQRLISLRIKALTERNKASGKEQDRLRQIHILFSKAVTRMTLYKEELLNFISSTELLKKHLPNVPEQDLDTLARYQKTLQNIDSSERRSGPYVAFEDLALILRLIQLKNGGLLDKIQDDTVNLYDHLVIDEAQDFGALEMTVLLASVRTRSGVTIVGDTNQKIIPDAAFMGWDMLAEQLGIEGAKVSNLEVSHRSTKPIMDLASSIINDPPSQGRTGVKPKLIITANQQDKIESLLTCLNDFVKDTPNAHICIVCRNLRDTSPLMEILKDKDVAAPIRIGHNKNFDFSAGITVTNLRQIKGLEFDAVILLDPSEENYPNDSQAKKYLYTAITRARDNLVMIGDSEPSSLLSSAIENSLLEVNNQLKVVPIEFTDEEDEPL